MLRIQPQSLDVGESNHFRVRFEKKEDGSIVEFTFSTAWDGDIGVLNCDQREFYFETYDDPAAQPIFKAITSFENAIQNESVKPLSISIEGERFQENYTVRFQTINGIVEGTAIVKNSETAKGSIDKSQNLVVVGDSAFATVTEGQPHAEHLIQAISALHQARNFSYETKASV